MGVGAVCNQSLALCVCVCVCVWVGVWVCGCVCSMQSITSSVCVCVCVQYADPVTDLLDKHRTFSDRLFRESCVFHKGNYVKVSGT